MKERMLTQKERFLLSSHVEELEKRGYTVFYIAHYGSFNYGLEYEGSDFDTKAIVLPSLDDVVRGKIPVSATVALEDGSQIDVKDIRVMFTNFKKQNANFLEILFSDFWMSSGKYMDDVMELRGRGEQIARYNNYAAMSCLMGMANEKYHALSHPYPSIAQEVAEIGFSRKQLHHILRLEEVMKRYIIRVPYGISLNVRTYPNFELLMETKTTLSDFSIAEKLATDSIQRMSEMRENYLAATPLFVDKEVEVFLEDFAARVLKKHLRKELEKDEKR